MKKLFLLLVTLLFITACSIDEGEKVNFHVEYVPIETVEMPEAFAPGQTYQIKVKYRNPTDCHYYDGIYYEKNGTVYTMAVQTIVIEDSDCQPMTDLEPLEAIFSFYCDPSTTTVGTSYTFRFYNGDDANGRTYEEIEVPVVF